MGGPDVCSETEFPKFGNVRQHESKCQGFGAKDARIEIVDNQFDGQGLENRDRAAQQPAIGISKRSCDWSEKSESEADWPIGEKKRDLLGQT